jgi:hypothetical protein
MAMELEKCCGCPCCNGWVDDNAKLEDKIKHLESEVARLERLNNG